MYRYVALAVYGVTRTAEVASRTEVVLGNHVLLDGEDGSEAIRTPKSQRVPRRWPPSQKCAERWSPNSSGC